MELWLGEDRMRKEPKNYSTWLGTVPKYLINDPLWKFETYKKACFLNDLTWFDCEKLLDDHRGKSIAYQLIRSTGSVSANIEEGYGRGFGKDYARFLRIAIGSARESKGWYFRGRRLIDEKWFNHRTQLLDDIISGLVIASNQQRKR